MDEEVKDQENSFNKLKLPFAFTFIGLTFLIAGIYFIISKNSSKGIKFTQENNVNSSVSSVSGELVIDLRGEVVNPGVYKMPSGSRLNDLINKAGGFTINADKVYIDKNINLAALVKDGAKYYIPKINNTSPEVQGSSVQGNLININNASKSQLDGLPDIGEVRAQKIIDGRPYNTIEELVEKKIITQTIFEKIKEKISVY